MEDACFASLDALSTCAPSDDQNTTNIARRSMSIFSRRGATPEPLSFVPLEAACPPKQMSEKQKSWLSRRRSNRDATSPRSGSLKSKRGTVLHAVPQASVIRMSALEEEMASSPNEEILSAISEQIPADYALTSRSVSQSSQRRDSPQSSTFIPRNGIKPLDRSSRIGVWVDGVVHWDECVSRTSKPEPNMDTASFISAPSETKTNGQKPYLSIEIPNGESRPHERMIYQPRPRRPLSSLMPTTHRHIEPPMDRPHAPLRKSPQSRASRSSRSSNSSLEEEASLCSNRSSATSVEASAIPRRECHAMLNLSQISREHGDGDIRGLSIKDEPTVAILTKQRTPNSATRSVPLTPATRERPNYDADVASPTWSQAEHDLQRELSTTPEDRVKADLGVVPAASRAGSIRRNGSVREVMQPPSRAPTIPKRSRKRDWRTRVAYPASELQRRQSEMQPKVSDLPKDASALRKSASVSFGANLINPNSKPLQAVPRPPERSSRRPLSSLASKGNDLAVPSHEAIVSRRKAIAAAMTSTVVAEDVLLHILSRLHSPKDLFRTAIINKGMYRVFKENEMHLLRTVVHNESPAGWELREWSAPEDDDVKSGMIHTGPEQSPQSYMRCYRRDLVVIERLKRLILETCQSFLRRETVFALSTPTHPNAPRFNDAFWRIWTFCKIFGSVKNREDDITGQMDWLRGGVLANNVDCIASTDPNMDFDMRSVLISPPACFSEGNKGGLSASQLFDMTEIWTCMTVLLQGYHGRVGQARYCGIFDQCEVEEGDIENEEATLEEWTAYLTTLGPAVVLEMAQLYPAAGFALAKDNGWTQWTPPIYNGSRTSFLKEPVAKSYEEQIVVAKQRSQDPQEQSRKDASRRRVATLAAEIRLRRQSSAYKRSPLIDMTTERAMSMSSRRGSVRSQYSRPTSRRDSAVATNMIPAPRKFHPIVEDKAESFDHAMADTGERAIQQLVAMGFGRDMAIDALRITDRGDGLRPDRAVELLLRQQE